MISHLGGSTTFQKFFHLDSLSFPRVPPWPQQSFVHDHLPHENSKQEDQGQNKCCFELGGLHLFLRFYLLRDGSNVDIDELFELTRTNDAVWIKV
jgi:hypothetical protein